MARWNLPMGTCTRENFRTDWCMGRGSSYGPMDSSTKDLSWTTLSQDLANTDGQTAHGTKASFWTARDTAKGNTTAQRTIPAITVTGNKASDTVTASYNSTRTHHTKVNSAKTYVTARAEWNTHLATHTKANGNTTRKAVLVLWTGSPKTNDTRASGLKICSMAMARTTGLMGRLSLSW